MDKRRIIVFGIVFLIECFIGLYLLRSIPFMGGIDYGFPIAYLFVNCGDFVSINACTKDYFFPGLIIDLVIYGVLAYFASFAFVSIYDKVKFNK